MGNLMPRHWRRNSRTSVRCYLQVPELTGFVKRAYADLAWAEAHIYCTKGRHGFAVHSDCDRAGLRIMSQLDAIPTVVLGKGGRTVGIADAHPFTTVNMEDAVMHGNSCSGVSGEMDVVELRGVLIGEDHHDRPAERLHVDCNSQLAVGGNFRQSELDRAARTGKGLSRIDQSQSGNAIFRTDLPVRSDWDGPVAVEYGERIGGIDGKNGQREREGNQRVDSVRHGCQSLHQIRSGRGRQAHLFLPLFLAGCRALEVFSRMNHPSKVPGEAMRPNRGSSCRWRCSLRRLRADGHRNLQSATHSHRRCPELQSSCASPL